MLRTNSSLPYFVQIADDGVPEFYLDHTLMSSFRACEGYFDLAHLQNKRTRQKAWALDFGGLFHEVMEYYYKAKYFSTDPFDEKEYLHYAANLWADNNFDRFKDTDQYKKVGGLTGYLILLGKYYSFYGNLLDNLTPVALEIPFGKGKEVPILDNHRIFPYAPFRVYLSGKIDLVFDSGRHFGPLDHKTYSRDNQNPLTQFEVQEGMTGYLYALNHIYHNKFESLAPGRTVDRIWMNCVFTGMTDTNSKGRPIQRFQRMPIIKSPSQLGEWRLRQISTAAKIYQVLFQNRIPDWDTTKCTNWYHGTCPYHPVHRLARPEDQLVLLQKDYVTEVWNPEKKEEKDAEDSLHNNS